eukprot:gene15001-4464_t
MSTLYFFPNADPGSSSIPVTNTLCGSADLCYNLGAPEEKDEDEDMDEMMEARRSLRPDNIVAMRIKMLQYNDHESDAELQRQLLSMEKK